MDAGSGRLDAPGPSSGMQRPRPSCSSATYAGPLRTRVPQPPTGASDTGGGDESGPKRARVDDAPEGREQLRPEAAAVAAAAEQQRQQRQQPAPQLRDVVEAHTVNNGPAQTLRNEPTAEPEAARAAVHDLLRFILFAQRLLGNTLLCWAWTDCSHLVGNSMLVNMLIYAGLQPRTLRGLRWLALSYVQQVHTAGLRVRHVSLDDVFLKLYLGAMALSWHAHLFSLITALSHMASLFYLVRRVQTTLRITDGAYSVLQFRQRGRPGEVVTVRVENFGTITSDAAGEGKTAAPGLVSSTASVVNGAVLEHQQPGSSGGVGGTVHVSFISKQVPIGPPTLAARSAFASWPAKEHAAASATIPGGEQEQEQRCAALCKAAGEHLGELRSVVCTVLQLVVPPASSTSGDALPTSSALPADLANTSAELQATVIHQGAASWKASVQQERGTEDPAAAAPGNLIKRVFDTYLYAPAFFHIDLALMVERLSALRAPLLAALRAGALAALWGPPAAAAAAAAAAGAAAGAALRLRGLIVGLTQQGQQAVAQTLNARQQQQPTDPQLTAGTTSVYGHTRVLTAGQMTPVELAAAAKRLLGAKHADRRTHTGGKGRGLVGVTGPEAVGAAASAAALLPAAMAQVPAASSLGRVPEAMVDLFPAVGTLLHANAAAAVAASELLPDEMAALGLHNMVANGLASEVKVAVKACVADPARLADLPGLASLSAGFGIPPTAEDLHLFAAMDADIREGLISLGGSVMGSTQLWYGGAMNSTDEQLHSNGPLRGVAADASQTDATAAAVKIYGRDAVARKVAKSIAGSADYEPGEKKADGSLSKGTSQGKSNGGTTGAGVANSQYIRIKPGVGAYCVPGSTEALVFKPKLDGELTTDQQAQDDLAVQQGYTVKKEAVGAAKGGAAGLGTAHGYGGFTSDEAYYVVKCPSPDKHIVVTPKYPAGGGDQFYCGAGGCGGKKYGVGLCPILAGPFKKRTDAKAAMMAMKE